MCDSNWRFEFNILIMDQFWYITIAMVAEDRWRTKMLQMRKSNDPRAQMSAGSSFRTLKSFRAIAGKKTVN